MFYPTQHTCQIQGLSALYEKYFGRKTKGLFVEVGAHNGISWSNTWGLAEVGWKGIYYEPVPDLYGQCVRNHSMHDVKVINACVGDHVGITKLWLGDNPTIDEETMLKSPWDSKYNPDDFIMMPCTTLNYSLRENNWPREFDLLCIDVEGAEMQVLDGLDFKRYEPYMLIIETHEGNVDNRKSFHAGTINDYMAHMPYRKIQFDGLNTIYWRL